MQLKSKILLHLSPNGQVPTDTNVLQGNCLNLDEFESTDASEADLACPEL
jgi:hypothetical protein